MGSGEPIVLPWAMTDRPVLENPQDLSPVGIPGFGQSGDLTLAGEGCRG